MEANPAIYNTNYINTTQEALDLIREVGSDGFRLNLDVGTMLENGERPWSKGSGRILFLGLPNTRFVHRAAFAKSTAFLV